MVVLRAWLSRAATLFFALVVLGLAPRAWATEAGAEAWAARCPAERGLAATVSFRAEALLVFELAPSGLKVEVRPDSPKSFRHAGAIGVSPIGEFADWNQAPAAQQAALETFVACAAADPTLSFTGAPLSALERSARRPGAVAVAVPWLLLGGLAALAAALWRARELRRRLRLLVLLFGGALALRAVLLPWAFFHQNGQGPLWVDYALGEPSPYGPGYREVFGWAARWALDGAHAPDRAVFAAQAVLGALVVPAGWLLANRAGARPALGLVVALLLALDPSLARAAQSESYYATLASLLFLATAALSLGACRRKLRQAPNLTLQGAARAAPPLHHAASQAMRGNVVFRGPLPTRGLLRRPILMCRALLGALLSAAPPSHGVLGAPAASERVGSVSFGLGVLGAGLFIAQAARLHPIGWVAAATVPLARLALAGRARTRVAETALAALGIGALTLLGAGRALLAVAGGQLGGQWLPQALARLSGVPPPARSDVVLLAVVFAVVFVGRRRAVLPLLALVACLASGSAASLLRNSPALILGGYWHLYAPVLVVAAVAILTELAPRRRGATATALVVGAVGVALAVATWPELTRQPTDVREQAWAMEWRGTLPPGARVAYVERAQARIVRLPLFGDAVRALYLGQGESRLSAPSKAGQLYYVRTSLCASADGRDACRRFEEQHRLRAIATRKLPSLASLPYLPLPEAAIEVGLYEVLPR